jgi:hypothetical protein
MKGDYPRFRASYSHEELVEHFLLTSAEHQLIAQCRGEVNHHGAAVLLTSLRYLGTSRLHCTRCPPTSKPSSPISSVCCGSRAYPIPPMNAPGGIISP